MAPVTSVSISCDLQSRAEPCFTSVTSRGNERASTAGLTMRNSNVFIIFVLDAVFHATWPAQSFFIGDGRFVTVSYYFAVHFALWGDDALLISLGAMLTLLI